MAFISHITIGGVTYDIKDANAQHGGLEFHLCTQASDTPYGVTWDDGGTTITGTLAASAADANTIYLVPAPSSEVGTDNIYYEYVPVTSGSSKIWEQLGDTRVSLTGLVTNVAKGDGDIVLGESTTFTNAASSVSFSGGSSDTFVKSYPGSTSKLETAQITGVGSNITFNAVSADPGTVTATNTVFGTDATASLIETESKTATACTFGTAKTASKATAGTAVSVAKVAASATNVSYIGDANTSSVLSSVSYDSGTETLTIGSATVTQGAVTGTNGTESITPYTFADVTVPNITAHSDVTIASVKTNTDVTVPVVSSNSAVTAAGQITLASKTAATAGTAKTVATGSLKADDTAGATVMTGLGTAVTASAVTGVGTATAAAQTITVGTNDKIKVAKYDDIVVTKHQ